jgi:hypothetical protein
MAEKRIDSVHGEAVETPSPPGEKSEAYHAEAVGRFERNAGLRIDGDDLDHEHEPKACLVLHLECKWLS